MGNLSDAWPRSPLSSVCIFFRPTKKFNTTFILNSINNNVHNNNTAAVVIKDDHRYNTTIISRFYCDALVSISIMDYFFFFFFVVVVG